MQGLVDWTWSRTCLWLKKIMGQRVISMEVMRIVYTATCFYGHEEHTRRREKLDWLPGLASLSESLLCGTFYHVVVKSLLPTLSVNILKERVWTLLFSLTVICFMLIYTQKSDLFSKYFFTLIEVYVPWMNYRLQSGSLVLVPTRNRRIVSSLAPAASLLPTLFYTLLKASVFPSWWTGP